MIILSSQTGRIDTLEKISNIDIPKNYSILQHASKEDLMLMLNLITVI